MFMTGMVPFTPAMMISPFFPMQMETVFDPIVIVFRILPEFTSQMIIVLFS
jgi:hypothetical protein